MSVHLLVHTCVCRRGLSRRCRPAQMSMHVCTRLHSHAWIHVRARVHKHVWPTVGWIRVCCRAVQYMNMRAGKQVDIQIYVLPRRSIYRCMCYQAGLSVLHIDFSTARLLILTYSRACAHVNAHVDTQVHTCPLAFPHPCTSVNARTTCSVHTCVHAHLHIHVYIHVCAPMCACARTCLCTCARTCVRTCPYRCLCMDTCLQVHSHFSSTISMPPSTKMSSGLCTKNQNVLRVVYQKPKYPQGCLPKNQNVLRVVYQKPKCPQGCLPKTKMSFGLSTKNQNVLRVPSLVPTTIPPTPACVEVRTHARILSCRHRRMDTWTHEPTPARTHARTHARTQACTHPRMRVPRHACAHGPSLAVSMCTPI